MNKSSSKIWIIVVVICVIGIFLYARYQNDRYANSFESSISKNENALLSNYANTTYGFSISYPNQFTATSTFASSYLLPTYWNIYSTEGTGEQVVAIVFPGSNNILSSELRIGISDEPDQVKACDKFDQNVTTSYHAINGEEFYVGTVSDAAMSHFSHVTSYRVVHKNVCFALDLVSFGTNPEVYSPPKTVPFDQRSAEAALGQVVESFTFTK